MTTVAIMQPYFYPYAGYFRLFSRADLFVLYDCVQFPRRGWVHRNRLTGASGQLQWLTLRLAHAAQDTVIRDMRLEPSAMEQLAADLRRFPAFERILAIARRLGADRYLNAPGGLDLYESDAFAREGIELEFLEPAAGSQASLLERLCSEDPESIRGDVR